MPNNSFTFERAKIDKLALRGNNYKSIIITIAHRLFVIITAQLICNNNRGAFALVIGCGY